MIARGTLQLLQTIPDPPNPLAEFERLISLVEEQEQTAMNKSVTRQPKSVAVDTKTQPIGRDKKGNEEPFVAPSAWLSVYDGKNTDSS